MVLNAADLNRFHAVLPDDATDVFPNSLFDALMNPGVTVLSAEDDVVMQAGVGVGHRDVLFDSVLIPSRSDDRW